MKILEPLFIDAIEKLLYNKVEFMLIGGYAVNYYGFHRYTGDLDFWINPTEENKSAFIDALVQLKCSPSNIGRIKNEIFPVTDVISIGEPPLRIDFLTKVNLVEFSDAWPKRNFLKVNNLELPIVDYHSLILMKMTTSRGKDKIDIEELQKIHQRKSKK